MKKTASLDEVLKYENPQLLRLYARKTGLPRDEVEELFVDLKKWLWLLGQERAASFPVMPEQAVIDNFWHEFILSTRDYFAFCERYLGGYLHHAPTPDGMNGASRELHQRDWDSYAVITADLLRGAMTEVHALLGPETVERWYREIPLRYGVEGRRR